MAVDALVQSHSYGTLIDPKKDYSFKRSADDSEYSKSKAENFKNWISEGANSTNKNAERSKLETSTWTNSISRNSTTIDEKLTDVWGKLMQDYLNEPDDTWVSNSITKSERYLLALYNNDESRNFISSYLMIVRTGYDRIESNSSVKDKLSRSLRDYLNSSRSSSDRLSFLRAVRNVGLSPSNAS